MRTEVLVRVSPSVRAVQVPDDDPMHPQCTTIYLVGNGQALAIDSGEAVDRYRWMLRGYLAAVERCEIALAAVTHHHADHSGNLRWAREVFGATVLVPRNGRTLLRGRLPSRGVELLADGQVIELDGGVRVRVLETPGHTRDSLCFYLEDEGVLFTGDTMLGSTTTTVSDLAAYRATLRRLLELPNLEVICPGHGPLIFDPRERIQAYIAHRDERERQILEFLERAGRPVTSWEIMLALYPDIHPRLRRAADNNVRAHLEQLAREGRLEVTPGIPREPDPERRAREAEHAREQERVIRLARKYEAARRRALIRAQESPPTEVWKRPPRYRLVGRARE
jgi:ribonuclease/clavin/mitogillin